MDLFFTYGTWWTPLPPAYGNITLENNVFGHTYKDDGTWHYYSLYVANTAERRRHARRLDGAQQHLRDRRRRRARTRPAARAGSATSAAGTACPACATATTSGEKCGGSDKAVSPPPRRRRSPAPLGWLDPGAHDFRLRAGSPAIDAADPSDHPATRPRRLRARRPRPTPGRTSSAPARPGPAGTAEAAANQGGNSRSGAGGCAPRSCASAAADLQAPAPLLRPARAAEPVGQRRARACSSGSARLRRGHEPRGVRTLRLRRCASGPRCGFAPAACRAAAIACSWWPPARPA